MHILSWTIAFVSTSGCSRPSSWTSPCKKFFYNIYTVLAFFLLHTLLLFQFLDLVFNVSNQDDFSDNFYLSIGIFISCCKMWTLLINRRNFANLIETFQKNPFQPTDANEAEIQMRFDKIAEKIPLTNTLTDGLQLATRFYSTCV
ncbi:uncharacterized protein LOC143183503 [Calliopsis andreniformis]|uniref:uncharacterized protein LOC143183503 n=1 Tax=Calliopsis andreniformis TaxID=337506 RepID=UPI003FCCA7E2